LFVVFGGRKEGKKMDECKRKLIASGERKRERERGEALR